MAFEGEAVFVAFPPSLVFDPDEELEAAKVSFVRVVFGMIQVLFSYFPILSSGNGFQFF